MTLITSQIEFDSLCQRIRNAGIVAFDTEFVSESYHRPRLCLLQFGVDGETLAVDPFAVDNLHPWWELMVDNETTVIVHGGREEIRFCQFATQQRPRRLVDVQIAEGLLSRGFPISYSNLVQRVLGKSLQHGKETRTDWQQRPLADQQLRYALEDVRHLTQVWRTQQMSLTKTERFEWAEAEFERFIDGVLAEEERDGWLRLSGWSRLNRREMAVARELYLWRLGEAELTNRPQKRILRDDLVLELARRQPKTVRELNMTRDMNRRDYQQHAETIVSVVKRALEIPDSELPRKQSGPQHPAQDEVLSRILGLVLANRCQELGLSMSLVATTADLKDFVRWHVFTDRSEERPKLMEGWRSQVCGQLLSDVLNGKMTLRVKNPKSEYPLSFERDE